MMWFFFFLSLHDFGLKVCSDFHYQGRFLVADQMQLVYVGSDFSIFF